MSRQLCNDAYGFAIKWLNRLCPGGLVKFPTSQCRRKTCNLAVYGSPAVPERGRQEPLHNIHVTLGNVAEEGPFHVVGKTFLGSCRPTACRCHHTIYTRAIRGNTRSCFRCCGAPSDTIYRHICPSNWACIAAEVLARTLAAPRFHGSPGTSPPSHHICQSALVNPLAFRKKR